MIVMIGLDHRRASVEMRGRLSFTGNALRAAITTLKSDVNADEVSLLSTCNRTEFYVAARDPEAAAKAILRFVSATIARAPVSVGREDDHVIEDDAFASILYSAYGLEAVEHLYHVSAGLRSMVIGEAQILGQVRDALAAAEECGTIGEELRAAFTGALQAGKRVRTDTGLSQADASVAALAVHVARTRLGSLAGARVTLIGAGKTIDLCARLLARDGVGSLTIANRNLESAQTLADSIGARAIALDAVGEAIAQSNLLIAATAAPFTVVTASQIGFRTTAAPLLIIDLAVPADVAPDAGLLPGVSLVTLDTLRDLPPGGADEPSAVGALVGRQGDIEEAERIITSALRDYTKAQTVRRAAPGISALRRHVDLSQRQELERALAQLPGLSDQERAIIERFGARLVDKMFHHLVRRIRTLAEYDEIPPEMSMRVLSRLFADTPNPEPSHEPES